MKKCDAHYFWHEEDQYTLTSKGFVWLRVSGFNGARPRCGEGFAAGSSSCMGAGAGASAGAIGCMPSAMSNGGSYGGSVVM